MDASVAGTRLKAIDSTHKANAVVTNPVYKIPPRAKGEWIMGEKSGMRKAKDGGSDDNATAVRVDAAADDDCC
eukprot:CAMPEP_0198148124 /NCGR_PEP_ID=MMETSP1443-20131203/39979_1 /TAXON_ID=186043 /ORGANISM="Entomoneis sp., Strain CCMP2396" /LENGTH=72 /DNA_ID=CAMNT_0043812723 /DNA_START=119 /DNA_END=337 /DNA_ORIENTATION=+